MTTVITEHLNSEHGRREMRALMQRGASAEEIVEAFANVAGGADAVLMRAEFAELPADFVSMFMNAWLVAANGGRRFTLTSRPPERPLEFARNGRVSYTLEHDESGVTVYVSHVHGRHAEWFKPAAVATI